MENQIKEAKRQLLKDELAGFEFNDRMKNKVLAEIHSTRKASKIMQNTKRVFPVILSASFIMLFFAGIYTFVLNSDSGGTNANDPQHKITVEDDHNQQPQNIEKETIDSESTSKQKDEPNDAKEAVYFDEEFAQLARQGFLKGIPHQIGTTVGKIKEQYGEPLQYGSGGGAYIMEYEDFSFYYGASLQYYERANVKDDVATIGAELQMKDKLYLSDMKKGLGTPYGAGVSDMDGNFMIEYHFGKYHLWARTESDEDSPLLYVRLVKKE